MSTTTSTQFDLSQLPPPPKPLGNYVPVRQSGNLLYTAGMLPLENGQLAFTGPVGSIALGIEEGQKAARLCILNALSAVHDYLGGTLEPVVQVVKITGFVNSAPGFYDQPKVINGASDCLVEVLGEPGKHARSAVGVASLPLNASVEIEIIVEIKPS